MTTWHGYFAVEELNLTGPQRQSLIAELRTLGPLSDPQPARRIHWRTRLDDKAAIFEAAFDQDNLTVEKFKNRLAAIFGVDVADIDHSTTSQSFSPGGDTPIVTFSHGGEEKIRVALFAGAGAAWQESRAETLGFLEANQADWEPAT
jgi:hypothetical protein